MECLTSKDCHQINLKTHLSVFTRCSSCFDFKVHSSYILHTLARKLYKKTTKQLYTNTKVENYDRRKDVIGSIHLPAHSLSLILILFLKLICLILMFVIFLFKSGLLYVCMFSSLINCFQIVNQCFQFS